MVKYLYKANI